jgi:hypothetical protein
LKRAVIQGVPGTKGLLSKVPHLGASKEHNWVQIIPGKSEFTLLRLYGPLEPRFKQTWRPDNIALVR